MPPDKQQWINRLMGDLEKLKRTGSEYAATLDDLRKSVRQFIKSENIGIREVQPSYFSHPGFDPTSGYAQKNTYIPAALSAVVYLLDEELTLLKRVHTCHETLIDKYQKQLARAFDAAKTCDHCGQLSELSQMRHLPPPQDNIFICEECWMNEYFDCRKCGRTLPSCEQGEEDTQLGYGWICKDCIKPMGFPQEVIVCPEHCEGMAFSDSGEMSDYYGNSTDRNGWLEERNGIRLHFVKLISPHFALYESQKGAKYEIGELDYRGRGSMQELEE